MTTTRLDKTLDDPRNNGTKTGPGSPPFVHRPTSSSSRACGCSGNSRRFGYTAAAPDLHRGPDQAVKAAKSSARVRMTLTLSASPRSRRRQRLPAVRAGRTGCGNSTCDRLPCRARGEERHLTQAASVLKLTP